MAHHSIAAIHDRIDEEHFEMRLHASAIQALQQRVIQLEAAVRELRRLAFDDEDADRPPHPNDKRSGARDSREPLSRQAAHDNRGPEKPSD